MSSTRSMVAGARPERRRTIATAPVHAVQPVQTNAMIARLVCLLGFFCPLVQADELSICFNYGCSATAKVTLSAADRDSLSAVFRDASDAASERYRIGEAIALMRSFVARQTPTGNDRPGNYDDGTVDGRMDCIDHARNSTAYLDFFHAAGLLKHHRVLAPVKRTRLIVSEHWAARIADAESREFAVDSWASELDAAVPIVPLQAWFERRGE